jgi:hypothetical protein
MIIIWYRDLGLIKKIGLRGKVKPRSPILFPPALSKPVYCFP